VDDEAGEIDLRGAVFEGQHGCDED
jgi:hypothetical protein